jgi:hypothetical protein
MALMFTDEELADHAEHLGIVAAGEPCPRPMRSHVAASLAGQRAVTDEPLTVRIDVMYAGHVIGASTIQIPMPGEML